MKAYLRRVNYYETDQMGITHHSNYIRWMEEARLDYLRQIGWGLEKLESLGMVSPVSNLQAGYRKNTTFPEEIAIQVTLTRYTGVRICLHYEMKNAAGEVVFEGDTESCFVDGEGKILRLKKACPGFSQALEAQLAAADSQAAER